MQAFTSIKAYKPEYSHFNLSDPFLFDCDFGQLIPIYWQECVPGSIIDYDIEAVVRLQPTIAPIMHNIDIRVELFFVPYRLIFDEWEDFITGGQNGRQEPAMPLWDSYYHPDDETAPEVPPKYSLWDYFRLPLVKVSEKSDANYANLPYSLPKRAYNLIWNQYYRDENIYTDDSETGDITDTGEVDLDNDDVLSRAWSKNDYFTSALPFVQRGTPGAIDIDLSGLDATFKGGISYFDLDDPKIYELEGSSSTSLNMTGIVDGSTGLNYNATTMSSGPAKSVTLAGASGAPLDPNGTTDLNMYMYKKGVLSGSTGDYDKTYTFLPLKSRGDVEIDTSGSGFGITANDVRWLMQVQKFLERNARSGSRYNEFVLAHFSVYTGDYRIGRVEFLGSCKSPIIVAEIPQTSQTVREGDNPSVQGNLAGKGLGALSSSFTRYRVPEHGIMMAMFSIVPKLSYASQGINKKWRRRTRYDFYLPEFAHLTEQPVKSCELFYSGDSAEDDIVFGYQGIYNEYRHNEAGLAGAMRDDFSFWHLSRKFANRPALNEDFLYIDNENTETGLKRIFAVPSEPGFVCSVLNKVSAVMPLPKFAEPGYCDHF